MTKKNVRVDGIGMSLHDIAKNMTANGEKMNHSTVRNIINRSFVKVVKNISCSYDLKYTTEEIFNIAKTPDLQESVVECLRKKNER
jgi:hypothetical protein